MRHRDRARYLQRLTGTSYKTATFEGNGFVIRTTWRCRRDQTVIGLRTGFTDDATLRNLGLDAGPGTTWNTNTVSDNEHSTATLVGWMEGGTLTASYALLCTVNGEDGEPIGEVGGTRWRYMGGRAPSPPAMQTSISHLAGIEVGIHRDVA